MITKEAWSLEASLSQEVAHLWARGEEEDLFQAYLLSTRAGEKSELYWEARSRVLEHLKRAIESSDAEVEYASVNRRMQSPLLYVGKDDYRLSFSPDERRRAYRLVYVGHVFSHLTQSSAFEMTWTDTYSSDEIVWYLEMAS